MQAPMLQVFIAHRLQAKHCGRPGRAVANKEQRSESGDLQSRVELTCKTPVTVPDTWSRVAVIVYG